jgi:predicted RNA-binding protein YlxR (DUF448 family)
MAKASAPTTRTCIVTREDMPAEALMRFVLGPDGSVVPDLKRKLPGRGVWVTATRDKVAEAVKRRLFSRGFGEEAKADAALVDLIDRLMVDAALGTLGLARKAGLVVTGFAKVETALKRGSAIGLVHAAEAAEDGQRKLQAVLRHSPGGGHAIPVVRAFSGAQLDLALGGVNVIHAAVLAGRAGEIFLERQAALLRYRGLLVDPEPVDGTRAEPIRED